MKYAALYRDKNYVFGFINDEGRFEYESTLNGNFFPCISDDVFETIKSLDIPNLGYNKLENGRYEVFNKKINESVEYEVPILAKVFEKIVLTKRKITLVLPTDESIKAAEEMYSLVEDELFKLNKKEEMEKLYKKISKGKGIAFVKSEDYSDIEQILRVSKDIKKLFNYQHQSYIVGIKQNEPSMVLKLKIPENLAGRVIGKGGSNIKEMCEILGIKRIEVIATNS